MHISIHTDKSTPIWTVRGAICDGHLPQKLFNKYEKKCVKLVNALADRKLTNVEAQRVVRIVEVLACTFSVSSYDSIDLVNYSPLWVTIAMGGYLTTLVDQNKKNLRKKTFFFARIFEDLAR